MHSFTLLPTLANTPPRERLFEDDPLFARGAVFLILLCVPMLLAMVTDTRLVADETPWIKPMKFAISLALYLATLAWAVRYIPGGLPKGRIFHIYQWIILTAIAAEMLWIAGAAHMATTSHFNVSTPLMGTLYGIMGFAAVTLTSAAFTYGWLIWRRGTDTAAPAVALSFMATFFVTVVVAGYMSSTPGHHVGIPVTGDSLPVFGWSREVGDLRVAHFLATHVMQIVPLAWFVLATVMEPKRGTAVLLTLGAVGVTIWTFVQALSGQPVF